MNSTNRPSSSTAEIHRERVRLISSEENPAPKLALMPRQPVLDAPARVPPAILLSWGEACADALTRLRNRRF